MKSYLKFCLIFILTVHSKQLQSQIKTGFVFGVNLSTIDIKVDGLDIPAGRPAGIHFGQYFEVPFNDYFILQSKLLFSAKGSDYKIDSADISISPIYIEIPLNAELRFGTGKVKMSVFGGPYFACGIGGYKIVSGGEMQEIRYGKRGFNDLRRFDLGYNIGAGINIKGFMIMFQYGIGLSDISPGQSADTEMKNNVFGITISSIGGGK